MELYSWVAPGFSLAIQLGMAAAKAPSNPYPRRVDAPWHGFCACIRATHPPNPPGCHAKTHARAPDGNSTPDIPHHAAAMRALNGLLAWRITFIFLPFGRGSQRELVLTE